MKEGITQENAKKVSKLIRDEGPKNVKAQIQGDELRVSSKSRDDLQRVRLVKAADLDFAKYSSRTIGKYVRITTWVFWMS